MTPESPPTASPKPAEPPPRSLSGLLRRDRRIAGFVLLVLIESLPVAGLVHALREGNRAWTAMAWLFLALGALPAIGVWLGKGWAYVLATYLGWIGLAAVVVRCLSEGFSAACYVLGGIPVGLLLTVQTSRPRPAPAPAQKAKAGAPAAPPGGQDAMVQWAKENLEAIVVAFIMALIIRCFCIEVFKIPSSSMQPTLMGDAGNGNRGGDRVMVTKFYYMLSAIERFDVVVFKFPLNQARNFIKRVVGLPGEELKILNGDIYTRPAGRPESPFRIARKAPRTQDSIWINPLTAPHQADPTPLLDDPDAFLKHWDVKPREASNRFQVRERELVTQESEGDRSVRFVLQKEITDEAGSRQPVPDAHLAFEFEITTPKGSVFAEIAGAYGRFEAVLSTDEASVLNWYESGREGAPPATIRHLRDFRLQSDRRYRFALSVWDGTARVRVNGRELAAYEFLTTDEEFRKIHQKDTAFAPTRLSFGTRDLTIRARNLLVGRDIFYQGKAGLEEGHPIEVPSGRYVMMGDNVSSSHDSRAWTLHRYHVRGRQEPIEAESQETTDGSAGDNLRAELRRKYHLSLEPDIAIRADKYGSDWAIYRKDPALVPSGAPVAILTEADAPEPFPFIDEDFIVGKALWVWWPMGRWFRLIR